MLARGVWFLTPRRDLGRRSGAGTPSLEGWSYVGQEFGAFRNLLGGGMTLGCPAAIRLFQDTWRVVQDRSLGSARGLAVGIAAIIVAWAVATTAFELVRLHVAAPRAQLGMEMALAAIGLFSAVVLLRIVAEGAGERQLRWVTAGFLMVGPGAGVFGYLLQLVGGDTNLNTSLYTSLV